MDLFAIIVELTAKIVDLFTEIVDLFSKIAVLQNPPGYGPVVTIKTTRGGSRVWQEECTMTM